MCPLSAYSVCAPSDNFIDIANLKLIISECYWQPLMWNHSFSVKYGAQQICESCFFRYGINLADYTLPLMIHIYIYIYHLKSIHPHSCHKHQLMDYWVYYPDFWLRIFSNRFGNHEGQYKYSIWTLFDHRNIYKLTDSHTNSSFFLLISNTRT